MNKIELTIEQDYLKNTRRVVANAHIPENTELRVSDKRTGVHASFDQRPLRQVSNNKPLKRNDQSEQSLKPNKKGY